MGSTKAHAQQSLFEKMVWLFPHLIATALSVIFVLQKRSAVLQQPFENAARPSETTDKPDFCTLTAPRIGQPRWEGHLLKSFGQAQLIDLNASKPYS